MATSITHQQDQYDHTLLRTTLQLQAEKYLWEDLKKIMKDDIKTIAANAVAKWAEVKIANDSSMDPYAGANIQVVFIEHIVKTEMRDNPISVTVKDMT